MWLFDLFSSIIQIWCVEVRISRRISKRPLDFEMTRVDCIWHMQKLGLYCRVRQKNPKKTCLQKRANWADFASTWTRQSLIRSFAVHWNIRLRLISAIAVHTWSEGIFSLGRLLWSIQYSNSLGSRKKIQVRAINHGRRIIKCPFDDASHMRIEY